MSRNRLLKNGSSELPDLIRDIGVFIRLAHRCLEEIDLLWLVFGFFATFFAPFSGELPTEGIPDGSEVFEFTFMIEALTLPGPRLFAAISGSVGTVIVVALAVVTIVRVRRTNPSLARGNVLIVLGMLVPAFGGSLTAFGESGGLAVSLAVGISLLWLGYRTASASRSADRKRTDAVQPEA